MPVPGRRWRSCSPRPSPATDAGLCAWKVAFILRRLALADMAEASTVHRTAFDERLPWLAGLHTSQEDAAYFQDRVFAECALWGAVQDGLIGIVAFRKGWVDQLYVLPGWQRQGVGSALLEVAKAASRSLSLWTFQRNAPACRFYAAHGFVTVRETDGNDNEEREPDVLYHWQVSLAGESLSHASRH